MRTKWTKPSTEPRHHAKPNAPVITDSQTPRFAAAYKECLDDTGAITRLEPLYNLCRRLEFEVRQAACDSVYCSKCGNYVPGHATGSADICTCL